MADTQINHQKEDSQDLDSTTTLRRILSSSGRRRIDVGTAILPKPLFSEDEYANIVSSEFNSIVIEHHLKWAPLCEALPGPHQELQETYEVSGSRYDFTHVDRMVDFAIKHNLKIKGHVLIWHVTSPKYLEQLSAEQLKLEMRRHIFTVMGRYKNQIKTWDVVNESLSPDGSLAQNIFMRKLGPSYIEYAFECAAEADPDAFLIYNDNKVEGINSKKSEAFYNLLKYLKKEKNIPIHGAGIQAHFNAAGTGRNRIPSPTEIKAQIKRIGELGLTVNISEMDCRISKLPERCVDHSKEGDMGGMDLRTFAQKQIYKDVLSAVLEEPAFDGIWFWGFTDKHTWVKNFYYDDEPLLWDVEYKRKQAYFGIREALETFAGGTANNNKKEWSEDWGSIWRQAEPESVIKEQEQVNSSENDKPDWELESEQ